MDVDSELGIGGMQGDTRVGMGLYPLYVLHLRVRGYARWETHHLVDCVSTYSWYQGVMFTKTLPVLLFQFKLLSFPILIFVESDEDSQKGPKVARVSVGAAIAAQAET